MFLNNRYHDPTLGVFLSVDPLVGKTGTPYLYANGNPATLSDPSGLDPWGRWGLFSMAMGLVAHVIIESAYMVQYPDTYAEVSFNSVIESTGRQRSGRLDLARPSPGDASDVGGQLSVDGLLDINEIKSERAGRQAAESDLEFYEEAIDAANLGGRSTTVYLRPGVVGLGGPAMPRVHWQTKRDDRAFTMHVETDWGVTLDAWRDTKGVVLYRWSATTVQTRVEEDSALFEEDRRPTLRDLYAWYGRVYRDNAERMVSQNHSAVASWGFCKPV